MALCRNYLIAFLVHELGHIAAVVFCCGKWNRISLKISGAVISCSVRGYTQEICCTAAGPAASFLLMLLMFRMRPELALISGSLGAVNLLPIYPLDGGRILRAILMLKLDEDRVNIILSRFAFVVCSILMGVACWITAELQTGIWPVFVVLVLLCRIGCAEREER